MNNKETKNQYLRIEQMILVLRNKSIILDIDLAVIYGTTTKRLNQAVKRNRERFPEDFMFRLTTNEAKEPVTNCDRLYKIKYLSNAPLAFTEYGTIQAANVLNSKLAIEMSVLVVRTFIKMRELLIVHKDIIEKLDKMERKYDQQFKVVFDAIRQLMLPPAMQKNRIGF